MSQNLPGYETGRTIAPREILLSDQGRIQLPIVVDGLNGVDGGNTFSYEIRPGWLLGQISASRLWVPCKRTRTNGAEGGGSNDVVVHNAAAFQIGDAVDVGATTNRNVTAVDYANQTITVDGAALTWADGDSVVARDGSQTCRGVLLDFVKLRNADNSAAASKSAGLLIQGAVYSNRLLGDVTAVRNDPVAKLGGIRFSDDHGF